MLKKISHKFIYIFIAIILLFIFLFDQNNGLSITHINVSSSKIPEGFKDYKILQISDLHSKSFGKDQKRLVNKIIDVAPDLIVVTGDTVDSKNYNEDVCLPLFTQIVQVAPVYFVTGNHEAWSKEYDHFEKAVKATGVNVLRNEKTFIYLNNSSLQLLGIDDPDMMTYDNIESKLNELIDQSNDDLTILLSHRPELIDIYAKYGIDIVFSGHAHGGQIRLPFTQGIVAPNQGWFPEYTSGLYEMDDTKMIVSRGLGNSIIPQRLFNKPELVIVTLHNEE
jgi:hypothetical protein